MSRRASLQRASLVVAAAAGVAAGLIAVTGGLSIEIAGTPVRARDPLRPLAVALVGLIVFLAAGGRLTAARQSLDWAVVETRAAIQRLRRVMPPPWTLALTLALATTVVAWVWGTKAVGGADSYGYLSQAELWTKGLPRVEQPFVRQVPWPFALRSFSPLGYRPLSDFHPPVGAEAWTLVPIYAPGLPLVLAGAKIVGGTQAMFFVVPLFAGLLVGMTYGLGRQLASSGAGLVGAWLVATSPAVLFSAVTTMTDVPVAALWALACWLTLRDTRTSALGAGVAAALAILIRPNHVVLAPAIGLFYVFGLFARRSRSTSVASAALFSLGVLPGIAAVAAINTALYGDPAVSGYGDLSELFGLRFVGVNLKNYLSWIVETQTVVPIAGLVALCVPVRSLWPAATTRAMATTAIFTAAVWVSYLVYVNWDAWWYLRFLLAAWPMMLVGVGALAVRIARWRPSVTAPTLAAAIVWLGVFQLQVADRRDVFGLWAGERRFVVAAHMARRMTPENSVIIAGQHTGTIRYYGGRMTMHYDFLDTRWVDEGLDWLVAHGAHPYLLIEPWERPFVDEKFKGQRAAAILDAPALGTYREPGTLFLYDLAPVPGAPVHRQVVTGTYDDLWAVEKAPDPSIVFK